MNLQSYFERIAYTGGTEPTLENFIALHTGHTFNIPFENLSPYFGQRVSLDPQALFDKFVTRNRGGYCFEMNGFFSAVLRQMGYKVMDLLARGAFGDTYSAKLHEVLAVEADGVMYLADVGYGNDGIAVPLIIKEDEEQTAFGTTYKFSHDDKYGWVLERKAGGVFVKMYAFHLEPALPMEFEIANHYTATHPMSFFKMMRFCTKPTDTGRVTLTDAHLKTISNGEVSERALTGGEDEFKTLLKDIFGLDLDKIKAE